MKIIGEIVLFCAMHELPLRGHDESSDGICRGVFLDLIKYTAKHNPQFATKLEQLPKNATYTSAEVQNEILDVMAKSVLDTIKKECIFATFFCISADETKDNAKRELLTITLRYFSCSTMSIVEHFIGLTELTDMGAAAITKCILDKIGEMGLSLANCVAVTFDGASTMSGKISGVQARLKEKNPSIVYTHCYNHILNLCLVDTVKQITCARGFFDLLEALYVFISGSAIHVYFINCQKKSVSGKQKPIELKRACETRWSCRSSTIDAIYATYPFIIETLKWASKEGGTRSVQSKGLLLQINNYSFVQLLLVMKRIFATTRSLSDMLQSHTLDLAKACTLVDSTIMSLNDLKSDEIFQCMESEADAFCSKYNIQTSTRLRRQHRIPGHLGDSIVDSCLGHNEECTKADYIEIIDRIVSEMTRRFDKTNQSLMKSIQALIPSSRLFFQFDAIKPFANHYSLDITKLEEELPLAKTTVKHELEEKYPNNQRPEECISLTEVILSLEGYDDAFGEVLKVLRLAATIGVSSAAGERSFSCVKRIKTFLRSTMTTNRLSSLAILSIERDLSSALDLEAFVDNFANAHHNRRIKLY